MSPTEQRAESGSALPLTGERTLPGIDVENYWFRRHEVAYQALEPFCTGAVVLEAGCGEGYGADRMARVAHTVVGVDYDAATIAHAGRAYPAVRPLRANLVHLPLADGAIEVVSCLQVIEHLWDQPAFLAECRRVLRPAGTLLLTTPNRLTFSPGNATQNPFHTRELSPAELTGLLGEAGFAISRLLGLRHGKRLLAFDKRYGSFVDAQLAGPAATWHPTLRQDVVSVRTDDFELRGDDLDTSLDLVVVAIRA
jgi:SAM-dependent methyltransferase